MEPTDYVTLAYLVTGLLLLLLCAATGNRALRVRRALARLAP